MRKIPDDPRFEYVDYRHTDLHATFARVRKRQAAERQSKLKAAEESDSSKIRKIFHERQQKGTT